MTNEMLELFFEYIDCRINNENCDEIKEEIIELNSHYEQWTDDKFEEIQDAIDD